MTKQVSDTLTAAVLAERAKGLSYNKISEALSVQFAAEFPGITLNQIYGKVRRIVEKAEREGGIPAGDELPVSVEIKGKETISEKVIALSANDLANPNALMKAHGFDPNFFELVSAKANFWQCQKKDGSDGTLYQSKITVRPRIALVNEDIIDEYFRNKNFDGFAPVAPFKYNPEDEYLEINITDLHIGLLSWMPETGENYDLKIVETRFREAIADVVYRCRGRRFKAIRFVTLGDILHVDNSKQETTNGTFQQIDGRIPKIFDLAVDMISDALQELLVLKSPIEYVYIAGNHDRDSGYYLAKCIATMFRKNKNITFDISPNPIKAKTYGNNLVGYVHGDMPRKNLGTILLTNFRKEFGESTYAEVHCGHLHSKSEEIVNGIKVIHLPALCESSYWEHQQGYKSDRALLCYVWNGTTGKRESWVTNI